MRPGEAKERGVRFLLRNQLPTGEFPTLVSDDEAFAQARRDSNVFTTALVLHALCPMREDREVRRAARKAVRWLLEQRDPSGFWTFWGSATRDLPPEERIPPDVDCCAIIVAAFRDWDADFPYEAFVRDLERHRGRDGLFATWIYGTGLDWHPSVEPFVDRHEVDPVVNANAAYLFGQHGRTLREVEGYLERQIMSGRFHRPSFYYRSPAAFLYAVAKPAPLRPQRIGGEPARACRDLLTSLLSGKATPLEEAMALSAALKGSIPLPAGQGEGVLARLRESQAEDGGWDAHTLHRTYLRHYGSRELTTAFAVEAMALANGDLRG